jgi:hypothetical protein
VGFGRDQFSREFETEITGGQSALLGGRACPEVAFLRESASRFGKVLCLVFFAIFGRVSAENGFRGSL